jgi:hypothetical protein
MLRIEIDMFSGRPNPVWIISDKAETDRFLEAVAEATGVTAKQGAGFTGLGFREVRVDLIADDEPRKRRVPQQFALASTAAKDLRTSGALARRLIEAMPIRSKIQLVEHALTPLNAKLRDAILERLAEYLGDPPRIYRPKRWPPYNPLRTTIKDEKCTKCEYEVSQFNPGYWNTPTVQPHNNCYNYGRNSRTDTYAQPGRAHGAQTNIMQCNTVTAAAMADGLVKRCNCLPISEWPRRLVALVVDNQAPSFDYHWYRHQRGGFWGHKPGGGTARNVDNSNVVITNPETCDRGRYNQFCGYFYAGRSVVIN